MASLATIFKQVAREGARWGLYPVMRDGKVAVCEMVAEVPVTGTPGQMSVPIKVPRVVCSLDESSPMDAFSAVLMHRLKREHHDFMKMVRRRNDRLKAEAQRELDERRKDFRRKMERITAQRIFSIGR